MSQGVETRVWRRRKAAAAEAATFALALPPDVCLVVSPEGFGRLCAANPEFRLERTAEGVIEAMPPASSGTGSRNADITIQLGVWSKADGTGKVFDSSAGFTLPNGAVRSPDASWILMERWNTLTAEQKKIGFAPVCPDFVAELKSPSDDLVDLRRKMEEYIAQGIRLGWLIDPDSRTVEIYRGGRPMERLANPSTLSGEDVLPGFVLELKGILYD